MFRFNNYLSSEKKPQSILTGTDRDTKAHHYAIVYHDILSNLTPGHEQEEFGFHAKRFCSVLLRFFRYDQGLEETFLLCRELSRQYGSGMLRFKLAIYRFLGSFKYGWFVVSLWNKIKTSTLILRDIKRIWGYRSGWLGFQKPTNLPMF